MNACECEAGCLVFDNGVLLTADEGQCPFGEDRPADCPMNEVPCTGEEEEE